MRTDLENEGRGKVGIGSSFGSFWDNRLTTTNLGISHAGAAEETGPAGCLVGSGYTCKGFARSCHR
jgi:hypothetical protein